jgi:hypothetical protein
VSSSFSLLLSISISISARLSYAANPNSVSTVTPESLLPSSCRAHVPLRVTAFFLHCNRFPFSLIFVYVHFSPDIIKNNVPAEKVTEYRSFNKGLEEWLQLIIHESFPDWIYDEAKAQTYTEAVFHLALAFLKYVNPFEEEGNEKKNHDNLQSVTTSSISVLAPLIKQHINLSSIISLGSKHGILQLISKVIGVNSSDIIANVFQLLETNGLDVLANLVNSKTNK